MLQMIMPRWTGQEVLNGWFQPRAGMTTVDVLIGHDRIPIDRESFALLCANAVITDRADVRHALERCSIRFSVLEELARAADIPPALFFASSETVRTQIDRKMSVLLSGVSKSEFSLNSRGSLRLTDVELIIKDVLRKQQRLKELDPQLRLNPMVGLVRRPSSLSAAATTLREKLGLDLTVLRSRGSKGKAFEHLVALVEGQNIFVSQSVRNWMPQNLPPRARFAGMCVRDKAIPFIFINSADARGSLVPVGRQLLTLVLLTVCVARGKFRRVSYDDTADNLIDNFEYQLAEEVLMPGCEVTGWTVTSLDDIREHADACAVTPSALLMRARRFRLVDQETAVEWSQTLQDQFRAREPAPARAPKPVNALRKYNSAGYSRAFLRHYDEGRINAAEVVRYLFQNRLKANAIESFRESL